MSYTPVFGYRTFLQPDRGLRHAMRWYSQIGRRVWPYEIRNSCSIGG